MKKNSSIPARSSPGFTVAFVAQFIEKILPIHIIADL